MDIRNTLLLDRRKHYGALSGGSFGRIARGCDRAALSKKESRSRADPCIGEIPTPQLPERFRTSTVRGTRFGGTVLKSRTLFLNSYRISAEIGAALSSARSRRRTDPLHR